MQAEQTLPPATGLGEDFSRLRNLFARSFPFQETDAGVIREEIAAGEIVERPGSNEEFDWSITLHNIKELAETSKDAESRVRAAEERAERAEARAKVAEHWLRRLHQAVLEGLPQRGLSD